MPANHFDFSILIPTLGCKAECLWALLSSIEKQQVEKSTVEILLIQNGDKSTIEFDIILTKFSDLNIRHYKTEKIGINQARAFGLTKAAGDIILMLDDDVVLPHENYLLRLKLAHSDNPEVLALGGCYRSFKNASLLDRVYNLDARLSLRSSRRGFYSVDLLGGCVSYKKNLFDMFGLLPNSNLHYGATETEFHHRLFREGALLKYQQDLAVYHNPQMNFVDYCTKAYRQGNGFSSYCFYKGGIKRKVNLNFILLFLIFIREFFYSWGAGELPISRLFAPLLRSLRTFQNLIIQSFSNLKWWLRRCYANYINQKIAKRTMHYGSEGTLLVGDSLIGTNSDNKLLLQAAWGLVNVMPLANGLCLISGQCDQKNKLALDIANVDHLKDLSNWIQKFPNLIVTLYCSNNLLTPYELKRNTEKANKLLRQAKYKHKIKSIVLVDQDQLSRWPDPKLVYEASNRPQTLKISVVIPFYNNSLFLKRVVQSLCMQNYAKEKYEIILVSDGSSVEHVDFIKESAIQNSQIYISIIQWDKAVSDPKEFRAGMARQIGAMYARGEYLSFLDSDIVVQADYLSAIEKGFSIYSIIQAKRRMLSEESTQVIVQKSSSLSKENFINGIYEEEFYWENFKNNKEWESLWAYWKYTCTYCLSLKKQAFFDLGGFRPQYNRYGFEDVDLGYRAYLSGHRFGYLQSDVFHLYPQGSGADHHFNIAQRESLLVSSCETFYRLNLSPSLYEEFQFFLCGRNFNYQHLTAKDYIRMARLKDYTYSSLHSLRQLLHVIYFKYLHNSYFNCVTFLNGFYFKYLYHFFPRYIRPLSIRAYFKVTGFCYLLAIKIYYRYLRPFLLKPYYFTRYQYRKYALITRVEKDVQSE